MGFTFNEFNSIHQQRHLDSGTGWYNSCLTIDGRFRSDKAVRIPSNSDDIRLGNDYHVDGGQTGGGIQRLSQTSLISEKFSHHSINARITASKNQTPPDTPQFVRWNENIELYADSRLLRWCIVRWRINRNDPLELVIQFFEPCTSRNDFTTWMLSHLPSSQTMQLFDTLKYPLEGTLDWFSQFLQDNKSILGTVLKAMLLSALTTVRVPIRTPMPKLSKEWYHPTISTDMFLLKENNKMYICNGPLRVSIESVVHIARRHPIDTHRPKVRSDTLSRVLHIVCDGQKCTATLDTGVVEWSMPYRPITNGTIHTYVRSLLRMHERADANADTGCNFPPALIVPDSRGVKWNITYKQGIIHMKVEPYRIKGGGFVFTTDFGLTTGIPHMHTATRTACLDIMYVPDTHRNVMDRVVCIRSEQTADGRMTMCALLRGLIQLHGGAAPLPEVLVIETSDIRWRAQLAVVLKAFPLWDKHRTLPEFRRLLPSTVSFALTPDSKFVRVKEHPVVLPILTAKLEPEPVFMSADDMFAARHTFHEMEAILEPHTRCKNKIDLQINDDGFIACTRTRKRWTPSTVFVCNGQTWQNVRKVINLSTDRFTDVKCTSIAIPIATDSKFLGFIDNSVHNNAASLSISERPVYMCTGKLNGDVMMRPFPTHNELLEMLQFCTHNGNQLFDPKTDSKN